MLKKPCIVVVVGDGDEWRETVVGLLTAQCPSVDLRAATGGEGAVSAAFAEVIRKVRDASATPVSAAATPVKAKARAKKAAARSEVDLDRWGGGSAPPPSVEAATAEWDEVEDESAEEEASFLQGPRVGDRVISRWTGRTYYPAT